MVDYDKDAAVSLVKQIQLTSLVVVSLIVGLILLALKRMVGGIIFFVVT